MTPPHGVSRYYVGQAANLSERPKQHLRALRAGRHDNTRMQRSFDKYGEGSFRFEVVLVCRKSDLTFYEQTVLDMSVRASGEHRVLNVMRQCVRSHVGVKRSLETRARMSAAQKGRIFSPERVARMQGQGQGRVVPSEVREKISRSHKLRPRHPNSLKALSDAREGSTRIENLRKAKARSSYAHSQETRDKIAKTLTGRTQSLELIEKRIRHLRGRKQTPEEIAKRVASRRANALRKAGHGHD